MGLTRRFVLGGLAAAALPAGLRAQPAEFYPVPVEILGDLETLNGRVVLGNRNGDAQIVEFFDYNCGYCRHSAREVRPMLLANRQLKFTLVNFAVLGIQSIEATRVALAFSRQKADQYLTFHERLFARRGVKDGEMAIAVAVGMGADRARLLRDADGEPVTQAMLAAVRLGDRLGFQATPSFLVGRDAHSGFLDRPAKEKALANFLACERATCG